MLFIIYKTNVSNIVILIIIKLDLKKRIDLKDILGITVNNISDEFILHFKLLETDYRYSSPKKNEIISTIAEAYYKYTNSKLKIRVSLKTFLISTKKKKLRKALMMMKMIS